MTDMCRSRNFRLRGGGGGGGGQNLTEKGFVNFLSTVGSTSSTCLQWNQLSISKIIELFGSKGAPTFSNSVFPIELVIFKVTLGHLLPPPPPHSTSSLGTCLTDPSQNDRVSCFNHELFLVCIALIFL